MFSALALMLFFFTLNLQFGAVGIYAGIGKMKKLHVGPTECCLIVSASQKRSTSCG